MANDVSGRFFETTYLEGEGCNARGGAYDWLGGGDDDSDADEDGPST